MAKKPVTTAADQKKKPDVVLCIVIPRPFQIPLAMLFIMWDVRTKLIDKPAKAIKAANKCNIHRLR